MNDQRFVLREIAWREIFPWLLLFRTFRIAIQPSVMCVALVAVLSMPLVQRAGLVIFRVEKPISGEVQFISGSFRHLSPIEITFAEFTSPLLAMYSPGTTLSQFAYCVFVTLSTLAISALAGGIITRIAVMQLGREEQTGVISAWNVAKGRWFDYFSAPLYPLLGTAIIAFLSLPVGWMLLADVGTISAGILWFFVLVGGVISALMLLWLFVGWPLMWPAISAEETGDAFEAMSRSFAYAFQKPLQYAGYVFVVIVFGILGAAIVNFLCEQAVNCAWWSVSWGCGASRVQELREFMRVSNPSELKTSLRVGLGMMGALDSLLRSINSAFNYSFFWVSASGVYLLLRQDVDHTELDEVWSEDDAPRYPLPSLANNEDGVPVVQAKQEPSAATSPATEQEQAE